MESAREGWIHLDAAKAQLEKIRQEHANGLELIQKENNAKLADAIKEKDDVVKAFAALEWSSADEAKQLRTRARQRHICGNSKMSITRGIKPLVVSLPRICLFAVSSG